MNLLDKIFLIALCFILLIPIKIQEVLKVASRGLFPTFQETLDSGYFTLITCDISIYNKLSWYIE